MRGCGGRIRTADLRVMSPTSYHCSTPRPLMVVTDPGSVKPPAVRPSARLAALEERAQGEQGHDRHDLATQDHAVEVEGWPPLGVAVADDVHPRWLGSEAEPATSVALRVAARPATAADLRGRKVEHALALDRSAEDLLRLHAADSAPDDLVERLAARATLSRIAVRPLLCFGYFDRRCHASTSCNANVDYPPALDRWRGEDKMRPCPIARSLPGSRDSGAPESTSNVACAATTSSRQTPRVTGADRSTHGVARSKAS